jgi:iron complex outermembrane receptor protein
MRTRNGSLFLHALFIAVTFILTAGLSPPFAAAETTSDSKAEPGEESPEPVLTETIEVTATRLADEPDSEDRVPAHVTVVDGTSIERAGAPTIQDLLSLTTGVVVYDQVGNDIQKTFDLRGFNRGRGTRVYLDGAPLNDPRSNQVALELVPLEALERVQIARGSDAALGGGGTEAGIVRLDTERGEGALGGALSLAGGSFDTTRLRGKLQGSAGRFDYSLFGSTFDTEGFRVNAGGDVRQLSGVFGLGLAGERRLELSLLSSRSDLGNPGALSLEEFAENPDQSFNTEDFFDNRMTQFSLNFRGAVAGRFTASANLFFRDTTSESLSTSRFGGEFSLGSDGGVLGTTVQFTHDLDTGSLDNQLVFGVEWLDGQTDAEGVFTSGDFVDPSSNTSDNRILGLFVQDSLKLGGHWALLAGVRLDDQRVGYEESLPLSTANSRTYSEVSYRGGVNWNPSEHHGLYASYGEAFLPPTVEQLFAFPQFGSNADLKPQDSRNLELGYRGRWGRGLVLDAAVFVLDTDDEIIFVPDPVGFGGQNRNIGQTRRSGAEAAVRGRVGSGIELFAGLTLTDSEFRNGPNVGHEVPLVPRERVSAGIDAALPAGFKVRADGLFVGEQVLDNDEANSGPTLPSYTVVNLRLLWSAASLGGSAASQGFTLFIEARNLFDQRYATRGIYVFDFGTAENVVYVTPSPERRWLGGVEWRF